MIVGMDDHECEPGCCPSPGDDRRAWLRLGVTSVADREEIVANRVVRITVSEPKPINVTIEPGTGRLSVDGQPTSVKLTEANRTLFEQKWKRMRKLKRMINAIPGLAYMFEVGVEVAPDGTVRTFFRMRQP